jgi:serine/threonine protein kinase
MKNDLLDEIFKNYKVFIDTCSLLSEFCEIDNFFYQIIPLISKYKNKLIIPLKVFEELEKHTKNPKLAEKSRKVLDVLRTVSDYIEIRGEKNDTFADNLFQTVFTKFRLQYNLALITQDKNLSLDVLNLNNTNSVKSHYKIKVFKFDRNGQFIEFNKNGNVSYNSNGYKKNSNANQKSNVYDKNKAAKNNRCLRLCSKVTSLKDDRIYITEIPSENMEVRTRNGTIMLQRKISSGGEGTIYETNTKYVAKIYKKELVTLRKIKKIKLIISQKFECQGICFPIDELTNKYGEFVGYLMPRASGVELQKSLFIKPLFLKRFPNWKKIDTVNLSLTILEKIKYLHDRNIIMGDINPANILVVSPHEVYFVDTDSYQIEDYPCPVGTVNYTAPEIQRKHFNDFLRTKGNENFAIATLLFMIMLPGKPPYAQQGGEDPISNILNMNFSYPLGESSNKKTPEGPWRFIWSHLTYKIKQAFYETFNKGGLYSQENKRLGVDKWIALFSIYSDLLKKNKLQATDPASGELFPTSFKNFVDEEGKVHKREFSRIVDTRICERCQKEFNITEKMYRSYQAKGENLPTICPVCSIYETRKCETCGQMFNITKGEYEYFIKHNLKIPKNCQICRKQKKSISRTTIGSTSTKKNGCFITTATCAEYGKPDNCYELTMFRKFRDEWLSKQPDGLKLIEEYYRTAPTIVDLINKQNNKEDIYRLINDKFLVACLHFIEKCEYEKCKRLYIEMMEYLYHEKEKWSN